MASNPSSPDKGKKALLIGGVIALVAVFFLCICAGCAGFLYTRHTVVGRWEPVSRANQQSVMLNFNLEFKSDHTMTVNGTPTDINYTDSGDTITFTSGTGAFRQSETLEYSLNFLGNELSLRPKGAATWAKFKRI